MIRVREIKSSSNSNIATVYFACSYLLINVRSVLASDYVNEADNSASENEDQESSLIQKFELSDVYFAPRWEGEGPPNFTDNPNKVYCKKDYWWRSYIEKMDPPPPAIFARYLRWKRTSIDTSNITTMTNTANIFIGTYDPSNESDDRERPFYLHEAKRSVPNYDISSNLELVNSNHEELQSGFFRRAMKRKLSPHLPILPRNFDSRQLARGVKNNFVTLANLKRTAPEALSEIYTLSGNRVKRANKKNKPAKTVETKTTMTTTPRIKKVSMMNRARRAKLQKQIRLTAIPKLRKLTGDEVSSTTGVWDKLTALPFYSTTAQWATPTERRPQFKLLKTDDLQYFDSKEEVDEDDESYEAGDESVSSSDSLSRKRDKTLTEIIHQVRNSTSPLPTVLKIAGDEKSLKNFSNSVGGQTGISSPGPDASENELRRYWWKMKQTKRGKKDENQQGRGRSFTFSGKDDAHWSASAITRCFVSGDNTDTRPVVFWQKNIIVKLLFSLLFELQKSQFPFLISSIA